MLRAAGAAEGEEARRRARDSSPAAASRLEMGGGWRGHVRRCVRGARWGGGSRGGRREVEGAARSQGRGGGVRDGVTRGVAATGGIRNGMLGFHGSLAEYLFRVHTI
jgi:hypothetical protein